MAKDAITELRDLAQGIPPPGPGPRPQHSAGQPLAARSTVPVELVADLPERPSAAIETIAYFCAAELLANVAKHSKASHATVEAAHVPGLCGCGSATTVHGGARADLGSGLAGLIERLRTVDGKDGDQQPARRPYGGHRRASVTRLRAGARRCGS